MSFHSTRLTLTTVVLLFAVVVIIGCGDGGAPPPDLGLVTGVVTMDDKPLSGALVEFIPEASRPSTALTDSEGKYTLKFDHDNPGAAVGKHQVRITTQMTAAGVEGGGASVTVPERYNTSTELTADVKAGDNTIDFKLASQ